MANQYYNKQVSPKNNISSETKRVKKNMGGAMTQNPIPSNYSSDMGVAGGAMYKHGGRARHGLGGLALKGAAKVAKLFSKKSDGKVIRSFEPKVGFLKKDGLSVDEKLKMVESGDLDKATGQPKTMDLLKKSTSNVFDEGFGNKVDRLEKVFKRSTELMYKRLKKISSTIKSVKPNVPKTEIQKIISNSKIEIAKIKGQVSNEFRPQNEILDKEIVKLNQDFQKLRGEKVTKSGISKGKDKK